MDVSRTQTRTWTARDACGNTSTASRTVTWTSDNTAPVITTGGTTTTLGCNPTSGDINGALGTATATDGCGTPTVSAPSDGTVEAMDVLVHKQEHGQPVMLVVTHQLHHVL